MAKKQVTIEYIEAAIAKWQTRLRRAVRTIEKLEAQKKRLVKKTAKARDDLAVTTGKRPAPKPEPMAVTVVPEIAVPDPVVVIEDTGIPAFLQRKKLDPVAEQIAEEQKETKRKKAAGRIAKLKAKQSGETRKMPLTGKAALEAIRSGSQ